MAVNIEALYTDFKVLEQKVSETEDKCGEVIVLAKEVALVKGKLEIMTRLMWGIVLTLVGIFIQGLF